MVTRMLGADVAAAGPEPTAAPPRPVDPALAAAVDAAVRLTAADIAGVLLTDASGQTAEMGYCAGDWTVHAANLRVRRGHGLAGRILQTRKPWKVDEYRHDRSISAEEFLPVLAEEGTRSGLGAPVLVGDALVGVLMVWSRRPAAFDVAATQALVNLADLAAAAVTGRRRERAAVREAVELAGRCRDLAERVAVLEEAGEVADELATALLDGRELPDLLALVSARTGGDAVVLDPDLGELAACGAARPIQGRAAAHLRAGIERSAVLPPRAGFPRWTMLRTVVTENRPVAHLALCLPHAPTARDDRIAEHAATACAQRLARDHAVRTARSRVHADFVWQLLDGTVDEQVAQVRARELDCSLPTRLRVVLLPVPAHLVPVHLRAPRPGPAVPGEDAERCRLDALVALAERHARSAGVTVLAGRRDAMLALIVDAPDALHGADTAAARTLVVEVAHRLNGPARGGIVAAGVSACVGWSADLRAAHRQARYALAAATSRATAPRAGATDGVVLFDELGLLRFLLAPSDRADQLRFARGVLGPAIDYDAEHHTDLVATTSAYLDGGCSLTRAANRLYVHPKTVRYRLRRVEELTGRDLSGQQDRFDAQLAIAVLAAVQLDDQESGGRESGDQESPAGSPPDPATLS
ncbi:helix-turn-helix domain-containing protein [Pseudonocardia saturnea]